MKYIFAFLFALLFLFAPPARGGYGYVIVGDDIFTAKVQDADNVVRYGGDYWRDYVNTRLTVVQQWDGDQDGHFGQIQPGGVFLVRRDGYDPLWLALALVHEAAHVEQMRLGLPLDFCAEIAADKTTYHFARAVALDWTVRSSEECYGTDSNAGQSDPGLSPDPGQVLRPVGGDDYDDSHRSDPHEW